MYEENDVDGPLCGQGNAHRAHHIMASNVNGFGYAYGRNTNCIHKLNAAETETTEMPGIEYYSLYNISNSNISTVCFNSTHTTHIYGRMDPGNLTTDQAFY